MGIFLILWTARLFRRQVYICLMPMSGQISAQLRWACQDARHGIMRGAGEFRRGYRVIRTHAVRNPSATFSRCVGAAGCVVCAGAGAGGWVGAANCERARMLCGACGNVLVLRRLMPLYRSGSVRVCGAGSGRRAGERGACTGDAARSGGLRGMLGVPARVCADAGCAVAGYRVLGCGPVRRMPAASAAFRSPGLTAP